MRIGELASQADVNVQTLRFYEREGLLRRPQRTPGGYRCYERQDLERVTFIRVCQSLGFTLREVEQLIELHRVMSEPRHGARMNPAAVQGILELAQERIASMEEKIRVLSKMRLDLMGVAKALTSAVPAVCPASTAGNSRKK